MKALLTSILSMLWLVISAQPTITSDWITLGESMFNTTIEATSAPDPGPSGADVTWDFSGVTSSDTAVQIFLSYGEADTTPYADMFPEANIVQLIQGFNFYNYYFLSNDILEHYGFATAGLNAVFSDPNTVIEFPFTYQSSFDDEYQGTFTFQIDTLVFISDISGSTAVEADGYGTIILPNAVVDNVLRLKSTDIQYDTLDLGIGYSEISYNESQTYAWVSPDYPGGLASHSTISGYTISLVTGLPPDTTFLEESTTFSYNPEMLTVSTAETRLFEELTIAPNPVREVLRFLVNHDEGATYEVGIYTMDGKMVSGQDMFIPGGEHTFRIEIPQNPGTYVLTLQNTTGRQSVPFVVKE